MHIPPYYKKTTWQRFFVGAFFGSIIAYFIFIYMHGNIYEYLMEENQNLESQVTELKNHNEALLEEKKDLNEKSKQPLTIESIEIDITNTDELHLDRLIVHDLKELIKEEIRDIIGQKVSLISDSDSLLKSTIQNKKFTLDDFSYQFTVKTLTITETVKITAEAEISN